MLGLTVVLLGIEVSRCGSCGLVAPAIPALSKLHRAIADQLIRKETRLAPAEVRFLRKHLGWSGVDFAAYAGVQPETVSRWENGRTEMDPLADRLLRLLVAHSQPNATYSIDRLKEIAKVNRDTMPMRLRPINKDWKLAA